MNIKLPHETALAGFIFPAEAQHRTRPFQIQRKLTTQKQGKKNKTKLNNQKKKQKNPIVVSNLQTVNGSRGGFRVNPLLAVTCQIEYFRLNNSPSAPQYASCQLSYYHSRSCRLKARKLKIISSLCLVFFDLLFTPPTPFFIFFQKGHVTSLCDEMSHRSRRRRCRVSLSNALKSRRGNDPFVFFSSPSTQFEKSNVHEKQLSRSPGVALSYNPRLWILM